MTRIEINDSLINALVKMSDGNPGAVACLTEIINREATIDPQCLLAPFGAMMQLDMLGIYGSPVYIIWADKCNRDTRKMIMLLRAVQLGLFPRSLIKEMANDQLGEFNLTEEEFEALDDQVCKLLPKFQKAPQEVEK